MPIDDFRKCADTIFKEQGKVLFQYGHYSGYGPLRQWIADWFDVEYEQVLMGNSSMEFLTFCAALFMEKGDNFVRLPFCGITPQEIEEGISRLAKAIDYHRKK
ncbi:hypothetical protein D1BOALGB6SA_221 [Olavius sp. associated proteobacterium Delta 1]|nr:hypothetical protein D1BOALGB6SA_221 [Olavius sp. associated proteobacterium Delta 1]